MNNIYLKLYLPNGKISQYRSSRSTIRILSRVSLIKFKKAYLKVSYGNKVDCFGKLSEFYNDGYYQNPKELVYAIKTFWAEK